MTTVAKQQHIIMHVYYIAVYILQLANLYNDVQLASY